MKIEDKLLCVVLLLFGISFSLIGISILLEDYVWRLLFVPAVIIMLVSFFLLLDYLEIKEERRLGG